MSELKMSGKVIAINPAEEGISKAGKGWKRQSFVIDNGEKFNNKVCFGIFGADKIQEMMTVVGVGKDVEVSFNVSSREFSGKWYSQIDAWRVTTPNGSVQPNTNFANAGGADDDLPF